MENHPLSSCSSSNHHHAPPRKTMITDLTRDMLGEILRRISCGAGITSIQSYLSFGRVCRTWRSVAVDNPYRVPWLMLPKLNYNQKTRSFLGLVDKRIHKIKFSEVAISSWCSGSSEGLLVMTKKINQLGSYVVSNTPVTQGHFLYNPVTQDCINLPPLDHFVPKGVHWPPRPDEIVHMYYLNRPVTTLYLTKAIVVTSSSLSSSFNHHHHGRPDIVAVAAIFECFNQGCFMGFCRPGDKQWQLYILDIPANYRLNVVTEDLDEVNGEAGNKLRTETPIFDFITEGLNKVNGEADNKLRTQRPIFADVIVYHGALYAITQYTALVGVFKFDDSNGTSRVIPEIQWLNMRPMNLEMAFKDGNYLVESCNGELLMVVRRRRAVEGQSYLGTWKFLVFKLDESTVPVKWVRIESLGDQILFLGISHSKSIQVSDIPGARTGNCIYFTTDLSRRHLLFGGNSSPEPSRPYTCKDTGIYYLKDGRVESGSSSFFTHGNAAGELGIKSTPEFPAVFFTPNPLLPVFITPNVSS